MKRMNSFCLLLILLAGCLSAAGASERILYRFQGGTDGQAPMAGLLADEAGNLYGTTSSGGGGNCTSGCGTIFELSPPASPGGAWTETVLYRFQGAPDGAQPQTALLADAAGNLYGTTSTGGNRNCNATQAGGCGTVFELMKPSAPNTSWTEVILYNFIGVPSSNGHGDVASPNSIAFDQAGNIYGGAYDGGYCRAQQSGVYCDGGVFELAKPSSPGGAWTETVLHRFAKEAGNPAGPILDQAGNLYGTAPGGKYSFGEVFKLTPPSTPGGAWNESVVLTFKGRDGAFAEPGLVFDSGGNLYGATLGTPLGSPYGTIFELTPTAGGGWSESTPYNFTPYTNGDSPNGGLILDAKGNIYGSTMGGGQFGFGVVYKLSPPAAPGGAWTEQILFSFDNTNGADGVPNGGLTFGQSGALHGTTQTGGGTGCGGFGCGTIFRVVP